MERKKGNVPGLNSKTGENAIEPNGIDLFKGLIMKKLDEETVVNKLDRPALENNGKIRGTEYFLTNRGELQYLTEAEEQTLREKLTGQENYTDDPRLSNFGNYYILLSLFILFSMAVAAASFGVYFNYRREARGNAYVKIGKKLYDRLHVGDPVRAAIPSFKGSSYFALINDWGRLY